MRIIAWMYAVLILLAAYLLYLEHKDFSDPDACKRVCLAPCQCSANANVSGDF
jgi:hypothetical protein